MKKFEFSLEKVLGYNRLVYDRERNELAKLRAELSEIEKHLRMLETTLDDKSRSFNEQMAIGVRVDDIRQFNYLKENLENQIDATKIELFNKQKAVERQLQKVIVADQDVKKMERLRENQLEEYNKASEKENQDFILEGISRKLV